MSEEKEFDIFEKEGTDIEDCHRLGYVSCENTIARFVNRKSCY